MRRPVTDLPIVQLEPDTFELVNTWPSTRAAASMLGVSREGIYQSLRRGCARHGFRWMYKKTYYSWLRASYE